MAEMLSPSFLQGLNKKGAYNELIFLCFLLSNLEGKQ